MAARFFCDNCGAEVKRNSDRCPKCGRFFAFIRCPKCSYTGEEREFAKGCPLCGYCTPERKPVDNKSQNTLLLTEKKLPLWVYITALLGLLIVALVLYAIVM